MNSQHRADRLLDVWLQLEAPASPPPELLTDITARTSSLRPRPAWLARLEGHHVDVIQGGRRTGAPRLGLVLAIIGLLLVAVAAAAYFGSRPQNLVVAPTTGPTASAPAAAGPTAIPRQPEPGDAIPDELIGNWYVSSSEILYIMRGPNPYCQQRYQVAQDCWTWLFDGDIVPHADILTIVDGKLRDMSIGRQDCAGSVSTMSFKRTGDTLQLTVEPGSCFSRNFPPFKLVGTAGAPPSVPPLHYP
jgi:hypothetical protein